MSWLRDLRSFFVGKGSLTDMGERYPVLDRHYQSSIEGLHVIGNIAGTPDIKAALNAGYDVAHRIADLPHRCQKACDCAVAIIGAGAAGVNAALEFEKLRIPYILLEAEETFSTLKRFEPHHEFYLAKTGPRRIKGDLWFGDCAAGDLVRRWEQALRLRRLNLHEHERVLDIKKADAFEVVTDKGHYLCERVIVAVGKLVMLSRLDVAELKDSRILYQRPDPGQYRDRDVLVLGGSAEAVAYARALARQNRVTLCHRETVLDPLPEAVKTRLEQESRSGALTVLTQGRLEGLAPGSATLRSGDTFKTIPNDLIFSFIGVVRPQVETTEEPTGFLEKIGIRFENTWDWKRWISLGLVFSGVCTFYLTKKANPAWATFGGRSLGGWYPFLYSVLVVAFGIKAIFRYRDAMQTRKYLWLIFFQVAFYCVIPELILKNWRAYGLLYAWPLGLGPSTVQGYFYDATKFYFWWSLILSFVALPVLVMFTGKQYCTWICGCGGLAETVGDPWRHYSPKGPENVRRERAIYWVLGFAAVATLLVGLGIDSKLHGFFGGTYNWVVDTFLIGIIPISLYPFLGGKVWCRYWCPTAGFMHLLSGWFTKHKIGFYKIDSNKNRCIACNMCSRYCEVGIDVRKFALRGESFDNVSSSCIGCGICISVCPTGALAFGAAPLGAGATEPIRATWARPPHGKADGPPSRVEGRFSV